MKKYIAVLVAVAAILCATPVRAQKLDVGSGIYYGAHPEMAVRVEARVQVEAKTFTEVMDTLNEIPSGDYDGAGMWQNSPPIHKATLNWIASPDAATNPGIFYEVFGASTACPVSGSPTGAAKLATTAPGVLTYVDLSVLAGQIRCYFIRSALGSGPTLVEGADSGTAQAVIPLAGASGLAVSAQ